MLNLFAYRATQPSEMLSVEDPVGLLNDRTIQENTQNRHAKMIVAAWGNHGTHMKRSEHVAWLLSRFNIHCLHVTNAGEPGHPLYLRDDSRPFIWRERRGY